MSSRELLRGPIRRGLSAVALVAGATVLTGCMDNPFSQNNHEVTTFEAYDRDAAKCATEAATTVEAGISQDDINKADSLKKLTKTLNAEAVALTNTCILETTGIPTGTEGFVPVYPEITVIADAMAVGN